MAITAAFTSENDLENGVKRSKLKTIFIAISIKETFINT